MRLLHAGHPDDDDGAAAGPARSGRVHRSGGALWPSLPLYRLPAHRAGGAARAIAVELALAGAKKFHVVNRSRARGEELTALLNEKTSASAEFVEWNKTYSIPADAELVINSTSMGMVNTEGKQDIDFDSIRPGMLAADVIVNPPQTYFLDEAGKRGATTLQGLGMVVNQAVIGIKYWTGVDVDAKDLNDELLRVLGLA